MRNGWFKDYYRHSLASRGIRTSFYKKGAKKDSAIPGVFYKFDPNIKQDVQITPEEYANIKKFKKKKNKSLDHLSKNAKLKDLVESDIKLKDLMNEQKELSEKQFIDMQAAKTTKELMGSIDADDSKDLTPEEAYEFMLKGTVGGVNTKIVGSNIKDDYLLTFGTFDQRIKQGSNNALRRMLKNKDLTNEQRGLVKKELLGRLSISRKPHEDAAAKEAKEIKEKLEKEANKEMDEYMKGFVPLNPDIPEPEVEKIQEVKIKEHLSDGEVNLLDAVQSKTKNNKANKAIDGEESYLTEEDDEKLNNLLGY